jgi:hypothetical protein
MPSIQESMVQKEHFQQTKDEGEAPPSAERQRELIPVFRIADMERVTRWGISSAMTPKIKTVLVVAACALLSGAPLGAQDFIRIADLNPYEQIRIRSSSDSASMDRRYLGISRDTLVVDACSRCGESRISLNDISKLEVRRGRHSHFAAGMAVGTLAGLAFGLATDAENARIGPDNGRGDFLPLVVVPSAALGGLVGLVVRTPHWIPVSLPIKRSGN